MSDPKIIPTPALLRLNNAAVRAGLNRAFSPSWLDNNVDPEGIHVIEQILFHNEVEWRTRVLVKVKGTVEPVTGILDVSMSEWKYVEVVDAALRKALDEVRA